MSILIRSPRQASTVFGLQGNTVPRKKSLFFVNFQRANETTVAGGSGWQNNLGFVVKSLDRPAVQPTTEEVNQYNKKRQITTGFKLQPMRMSFYDTADNMAMQMWNEYSRWYFGDFAQPSSSFSYDTTAASFLDNANTGYGYSPRSSTSSTGVDQTPLDLNSQFFFSAISVYQVWGQEYTRFDLINPRITDFAPDDLDYSVTEPSAITISLAYEAILYANNAQPTPISQDPVVQAAFAGDFDGYTINVDGAATRVLTQTATPTVLSQYDTTSFSNLSTTSTPSLNLSGNSGNTLGSGSLSTFGNYDFGSLSPSNSLGGGTAADLSYTSAGNSNLTTLLNIPGNASAVSTPESDVLGSTGSTGSVSGAQYDASIGALNGAGAGSNPYASSYIDNNLVSGVSASSLLNGDSTQDQLTTNGSSGLALNSQSYGIINAQRPSYSQIGYNFNSGSNLNSYSSDSLQSAAGTAIPGKYNTNGIPTTAIPYSQLNQVDPSYQGQ